MGFFQNFIFLHLIVTSLFIFFFYLTDAIYCKLLAVAVLVSGRILDDSIEMRDFPSVCSLMVTQSTG